ncbi:hypothetical protein JD844_028916 [Phrynosoma platyrhinos]|uniref:Uncharacterized protein n=1 Tax=Phrynosoma platyrhinos TaxID=52577 RepID=A0ABQ7SIH2_PHRPL|nr:hypothetical protein JD844_028916 [Phrynosoma platyrhinos]
MPYEKLIYQTVRMLADWEKKELRSPVTDLVCVCTILIDILMKKTRLPESDRQAVYGDKMICVAMEKKNLRNSSSLTQLSFISPQVKTDCEALPVHGCTFGEEKPSFVTIRENEEPSFSFCSSSLT